MFSQLKSKINHNYSAFFNACLTEDSGNATNGRKYFCDRLLSTSLFGLINDLFVNFYAKRLTHFNEMWTQMFFPVPFGGGGLICKSAEEKFCHFQTVATENKKCWYVKQIDSFSFFGGSIQISQSFYEKA